MAGINQWDLGGCDCPSGALCNGHTIPSTLHYSGSACWTGPFNLAFSATGPPPPTGGEAPLGPNPNKWWYYQGGLYISMSCAGGGVSVTFYTWVAGGTPPFWEACTFSGTVGSYSPFSFTAVCPTTVCTWLNVNCGGVTINVTITA